MPRKPREEVEGGIHHVYARGNDRRCIYVDDADRQAYLRLLGLVVTRSGWHCLAYCLMNNHVHLLLETPEPNLGRGMQRLHGVYAHAFNERHGTCGHVFQGRFGAVRVQDEAQLLATVAYIALNPVTAGLTDRPEAWRWSSHAALLTARAPNWLDDARLLSYFAALGGEPQRRYEDLIDGRTSVRNG